MPELVGHYVSVEDVDRGGGFAVWLNGHNVGALFILTTRPTYATALVEAQAEAERRGVELVDKVGARAGEVVDG